MGSYADPLFTQSKRLILFPQFSPRVDRRSGAVGLHHSPTHTHAFLSPSPSAGRKPSDVILPPAGVDPTRSDGFAVLVADAPAVDVGDARREDRQGAFHGLHMVVLPVEFGAAVGHVVAVENPVQHAADRFGGLLGGGPVAVPGVEGFAGGVALQVEDRQHERNGQHGVMVVLGEAQPVVVARAAQADRTAPDRACRGCRSAGQATPGPRARLG